MLPMLECVKRQKIDNPNRFNSIINTSGLVNEILKYMDSNAIVIFKDINKYSKNAVFNYEYNIKYYKIEDYQHNVMFNMKFLAKYMPKTTVINLDNATDLDMVVLIPKLSNLKRLCIADSLKISDQSFEYLVNNNNYFNDSFRYLSTLHTLVIDNCKNITNNIFKYLPNLHKLELWNCDITDDAFKYLSNIRDLQLINCDNITDNAFKYLQNLQTLFIGGCINITDNAFKHIPNLHKLNICDSEYNIYNGLKYLENLHILGLHDRYDQDFPYDIFKNLINLEELEINITNDFAKNSPIDILINCQKIKKIQMDYIGILPKHDYHKYVNDQGDVIVEDNILDNFFDTICSYLPKESDIEFTCGYIFKKMDL